MCKLCGGTGKIGNDGYYFVCSCKNGEKIKREEELLNRQIENREE